MNSPLLMSIKRRMIAAWRSGDEEALKRLSQEKERAKRRVRGRCLDCGVTVDRRSARCNMHSRIARFYRRSIGFALMLATFGIWATPGLLRNSLTLVWTDPTGTNQSTAAFSVNVYASPTLAVPLTNWALFTNIAGTNLSVTIPIQPQQMFFVATYSNLWGESPFSGVASAPPPPTNGTLNIK